MQFTKELLSSGSGGSSSKLEATIELTGIETSDWELIPDTAQIITVQIEFTGGAEGKMQTTNDSENEVLTGSPVPADWPFGIVYEDRVDACLPVTAIRAVQTASGTMTVKLVAQ